MIYFVPLCAFGTQTHTFYSMKFINICPKKRAGRAHTLHTQNQKISNSPRSSRIINNYTTFV